MRSAALAVCAAAFAALAFAALARAEALADAQALVASTVPEVSLTACSGGGYDLSSLGGQEMAGSDGANFRFLANLCSTVSAETQCQQKGGALCQYTAARAFLRSWAKWDGSAQWTSCADKTKCPNGGFVVQYANGDMCGSSPFQANFMFACSQGGTSTSFMAYFDSSAPCLGTFLWSHNIGCQTPQPTPGPGGDGGSGGGLSGGSIFLIILVVVLPLYVMVGCIFNRRKGAEGVEACPNVDFWRDLPALVGDGFKFTWRKCCGLCGKGGDNYEGMK